MAQGFGLLVAAIFFIFFSLLLAIGLISLICYYILYSRFKSWKYYKRCFLFTFLGGCVGIFITYGLLPKTLNSQIIPYTIILGCMAAGGFGILLTKVEEVK